MYRENKEMEESHPLLLSSWLAPPTCHSDISLTQGGRGKAQGADPLPLTLRVAKTGKN
jgi:hypothetical protein